MQADFQQLKEFIDKHDKFIISTHESPDGDGIGAEIAFNELLRNLGKKALIINSDQTPDTLTFLDVENEIVVLDDDYSLPDDINEYAQFVLDTHDFDNIGSAYHCLKDHVKDLFIIDHHEGNNQKHKKNLIRAHSSSTSEIIYSIMTAFNTPLTFKSAQAIYAGMLFDTGSFRYPKTTAETYRVAAHCIELGANPFNIYEHIYESNSLSSFELRGKILSSMEVLFNGKMIVLKLTPEMLKETGAHFTEGEPSINIPLTVKGVVTSVLIKQDIEGPVKVSMRTKGDYDVSKIAISNGGGGHKNAAGYKSKVDFDATYKAAIEQLSTFFT